uniref:Protein ARV n=1 Tax=Oryza meridionalis TaxID=40149 RepID=A0A0E0D7T0_9ORYZ
MRRKPETQQPEIPLPAPHASSMAHQKRAVASSRLVSSPATLTDDATPATGGAAPGSLTRRGRSGRDRFLVGVGHFGFDGRRQGRRGGAAALRRLRPACEDALRAVLPGQHPSDEMRKGGTIVVDRACDTCKAVADPYIECEFMIILIDLILHKTRAYRHLLFNKLRIYSSLDKGVLVLSILTHLVLDACNKADGDSSINIFSAVLNCSKVLGDALLGNIVFMAMLFLEVQFILKLSFDIRRYREVLLAVIISSYFKLFLMAMMVWEFPSSVIFFVEISVLSSNTVALRVVTEFSKAHCFGVCFGAHAARYLTERWLLGSP